MKKAELITWLENPLIYEKNVLLPHSDHRSLMEDGMVKQTVSLNGTWDFQYFETPDQMDMELVLNENAAKLKQSIKVPGHLQLQGYGRPQYVNTQYPWDGHEDIHAPEVPKKFNPTGVYGKVFELPEEFKGKRVRINFEGVESCFFLWVNGEFIGYHENSFCPAEFDITDYVKEKDNYICAAVIRFCSASWLEDQDFIRFSGIFRDVSLYSVEKIHIEDMEVKTNLTEEFQSGNVDLNIRFDNQIEEVNQYQVKVTVKEKDNQGIAAVFEDRQTFGKHDMAYAKLEVQNPRLWSAEAPNLYVCRVDVFDENGNWMTSAETEFGFRKFELREKIMYLNGERIVFRGVNRHEFHGRMGRAITEKEIEEDILLMKRNNINAVRTSHYPNQKAFYKLCDKYGLYVIDETNLETHGTWQKIGKVVSVDDPTLVPGDNPMWKPAVLERGQSMVERDKNHPCILMWSCGNESFGGSVMRDLSAWFHNRDESRLVHYEGVFQDRRYNETSDVESRMYAKPQEIREYLEADPEKPFVLCEYTHAMGNSCGGMQRYTELEDTHMMYQGGFIWDFSDQALLKESADGKTYYAPGGEFDDRPNDGYFSGNGLCFADHTPTPKMEEVKFLYQPITIKVENEKIYIRNRQLFVSTADYEFRWELRENGVCVKKGSFYQSVNPQTTESYPLPDECRQYKELDGEVVFHCAVCLREETIWAEKGFEIGFGQGILKNKNESAENLSPAEIVEGDFNIGIKMQNCSAMVSKADGRLISIKKGEKEYLNYPLKPDFWRAPVDNDTGNNNTFRWAQWKLASMYQKCVDIKVNPENGNISTKFEMATNPKSYCTVTYQCYYDNRIEVGVQVESTETEAPCIGFVCKLKKEFEYMQWYGNCQKESCSDRRNGRRIGLTEDLVKNQYVPYLNPQENGNKTDVRFVAVKNEEGNGIKVSGNTPFEFSALPYTSHEMENAENIVSLPNSQNTVLGVYGKKSGVAGDDSWGAPVEDSCIVRTNESLNVCIEIF